MDFYTALKAVQDGQLIARESWGGDESYIDITDGILMIHNEEGDHNWIISLDDMMGTDWFILDDSDLAFE